MQGNSSNDTHTQIANVERHNGVGQAPLTATGPATWGSSGGASFAAVVGSTDKPVEARQRRSGGEVRGVRNSNTSAVQGSRGTWVSTGDAVALQYERARKEAAELARYEGHLCGVII